MKVNVGIDLGTTYSAVSVFDKTTGETRILKNGNDEDYTPSVVHIQNKKVTIGSEAKDLQAFGDINTAAFYKTWMGDKTILMYLDGNEYSSEELSGLYLKELKKDIEKRNNITIEGAVITVPAYFNEGQRQATINAGKKAGLNVLKIINEPTAAIIAYGLTGGPKKNVMVYDLGGGTFDVTIAEVENSNVTVKGTNGDHQLGGKDWDAVIIKYLIEQFENEYEININDYPEDYRELQVECEQVKKKLSSLSKVTASVKCDGFIGRYEVTREWFEQATEDLLSKTKLLIQNCFDELGDDFGWNNIDEVVLVGGSTRMPQVREMVASMTGKAPITNVNVDTVVSQGAAIQAALCKENTITLALGKTGTSSYNQASGKKSLTLSLGSIQDVTSHSLGLLSTSEDNSCYVNTIIIPKNATVPSTQTRPFKIKTRKNDNFIDAYILQGESTCPIDNHILGRYNIENIENEASGEAVIDISYTYDSNGMVVVSAVQRSNKKQLKVTKYEVPSDISWMNEPPAVTQSAVSCKIYLAIDTSYSMHSDRHQVVQAANAFCDDLDFTSTKVGIIAFGDKISNNCEPTHDRKDVNKELNQIITYIDKGTYGFGTSSQPLSYLLKSFGKMDEKNYIVVLTDGEWDAKSNEQTAAQKLKAKGIEIVALGIGSASSSFLESIASSSEASLKTDINNLKNTFSSIAQAITEGKNKITLS